VGITTHMAKQDENMVECAHCHRLIPIGEAKSYGRFDNNEGLQYFCSVEHAMAHLFWWVRETNGKREFVLGL
jgi:hypothetical protein